MMIFVVPVSKYLNGKALGGWSIGRLARNCDLNFTTFEAFGNKMIGLDRIKSKLLFLKQMNNRICYCIINLKQVESCILKRTYSSIEAGGLKKRNLDYYLNTVSLELRLKNYGKTIALPFYEKNAAGVQDIPQLEGKAQIWMKIITAVQSLFTIEHREIPPHLLVG